MPTRAVVRAGYDLVSTVYEDDAGRMGAALRRPWMVRLRDLVPSGGLVLDLGCGAGVPVARDLARDHRVIGVDLSGVQLERARRLATDAAYAQADIATVAFHDGVFDAVVCLYALIHVPVEAIGRCWRIAPWLRPGGVLMVITGHTATNGVERDWMACRARPCTGVTPTGRRTPLAARARLPAAARRVRRRGRRWAPPRGHTYRRCPAAAVSITNAPSNGTPLNGPYPYRSDGVARHQGGGVSGCRPPQSTTHFLKDGRGWMRTRRQSR